MPGGLISEVAANSLAERVGLRPGDELVSINGRVLRDVIDVRFCAAEEDLKLRGPGELLSTRQHGLPDLKIADIIDDFDLLSLARKDAFELVEADAMLRSARHKNIRAELGRKFADSLGLVDVG